MKKITKLLALFLATAMSISLFTACHKEPADTAKVSISYWMDGNPNTMEPGMSLDSVAEGILRNTYVPLLYVDNLGNKVFKNAKSYEISNDGMVYMFHLREDAKWSDGKPVLAADFEYGWKRLADPAHICENAYSFTMLKNGLDVITGKVPASELGVTAVSDYTLRIDLDAPCNYFLNKLGSSAFFPQRKDICESDDAWFRNVSKLKISTGPFMVTEWTLNSEMVLSKNPYYYNAKNVKIDEIVIPLVAEPNTAFTAFEANQLDGMKGTPELLRMLVEQPEVVVRIPGCAVNAMMFNVKKTPLDDIRVRKALALAIDRPEFIETLGRKMQNYPTASFIPPEIYINGQELHRAGEILFDIDPNKAKIDEAKMLMTEAGYPNGNGFPSIAIVIASDDVGLRICEILSSMWGELGVKVEIHPFEEKVFNDMVVAGDYQVTNIMFGDTPDPYNFLETWLPGHGYNSMGFNPPEFAEAFNKASTNPDPEVQKEQLLKAEEIFMSGYALCPLWYSSFTFYQRPFLKGIEYQVDFPMFENAHVEKNS